MIDIEVLCRNKIIEQKKSTINALKEKTELEKLLIEQINEELKLIGKIEELTKENMRLKKKYEVLSKSKLGRLTLKYWKIRKGLIFK